MDARRIITEMLHVTGMTQTQLATVLNVTQSTVSRWRRGSKPDQEQREAILAEARRLGIVDGLDNDALKRTVPIVGHVGAGAECHLYSEAQGPFGEAEMPPGGGRFTVAVVVRGDSMLPVAENDWVLYYNRRSDPPTTDHIGKLCVLGLADGRVVVKKLYPGRLQHHWNLLSANAAPMLDQEVEWAAVVTWIKPT